jgi:hypothetical protein
MKNADETTVPILNDASRNVLMRHLGFFLDNDLKCLLSDYTNESVLITQEAIHTGPAEIKIFFEGLMKHFPKKKSNLQLDKLEVCDELVFIVWHATTPSVHVRFGSDTFIIKEDKIRQQTFVGHLEFR